MADKKENYKVFSWWRAYLLNIIGKLREKYQNPNEILKDYIHKGMTVADIGCGLGFFTLTMASMVGRKGKVLAVDLQSQMLRGLANKAKKQDKLQQIELIGCSKDSLQLHAWEKELDFILLFAVAHEVPNREKLFKEIAAAMKKDAKLLLVEPRGHVSETCFNESVRLAKACSLRAIEYPKINLSYTTLLVKK